MAEDGIDRYHHQLNGHDLEPTLGDSEGQGKPGMLQSVGVTESRIQLSD